MPHLRVSHLRGTSISGVRHLMGTPISEVPHTSVSPLRATSRSWCPLSKHPICISGCSPSGYPTSCVPPPQGCPTLEVPLSWDAPSQDVPHEGYPHLRASHLSGAPHLHTKPQIVPSDGEPPFRGAFTSGISYLRLSHIRSASHLGAFASECPTSGVSSPQGSPYIPGCSISVYPTTGVPQLRGLHPQGIPPQGIPPGGVFLCQDAPSQAVPPEGYLTSGVSCLRDRTPHLRAFPHLRLSRLMGGPYLGATSQWCPT